MGGENNLVVLKGSASQGAVLAGVANKFHVLIEIVTGKRSDVVKRQDVELAIVLDKSGSMEGSKLAGAKKAVKVVIDNLGATDSLHLVTYDSDAKTEFANGDLKDKDTLTRCVDRVRAGSMTNMGGGLKLAKSIFKANGVSGSDKKKRIFLFSDGLVNEGAQGSHLLNMVTDLFECGVQTSAFGIGQDFSEQLMKQIAELGRGDYTFLDKESHIHKYVEKSLRSLLGTLGSDGVLKVRGKNGCVVREIVGHDAMKGAFIGDLREDNHKQIVLEVEVSVSDNKEQQPMLDVVLTYQDSQTKEEVSVPMQMIFDVTEDESVALAKNESTEKVEVALLILKASESDRQIVQLLDAGRVEEAVRTKIENITRLEAHSSRDNNGYIASVVKRGKKTIEKMESGASVSRMRKCVDYEAEMEEQMSAASLNYNSDSGGEDEDSDAHYLGRLSPPTTMKPSPTASANAPNKRRGPAARILSFFNMNAPAAATNSINSNNMNDNDDDDCMSDAS